MLVDDLIEWRNVVIATSGSSVGGIHRFRGISRTYGTSGGI